MRHPSLQSYLKSVSLMHRVVAAAVVAVLVSGSSHAAGIPISCAGTADNSFSVTDSEALFDGIQGSVTESPPVPGLQKFMVAPGNCPGLTTTNWDVQYNAIPEDVASSRALFYTNVMAAMITFVTPQGRALPFDLFISADGTASLSGTPGTVLTISDSLCKFDQLHPNCQQLPIILSTFLSIDFQTNGATGFNLQSPIGLPGSEMDLPGGQYTLEQDVQVGFHPTMDDASWEFSFPNSIDSVLLTPVPEPGSLGVILLSLGVAVAIMRPASAWLAPLASRRRGQ